MRKRAGVWLAGAAVLPALAAAQTTSGVPQTDPSLDRFSLPPSTRPSPRPTPTSGPIVAPLSTPTSAAPVVVATPTPAPRPTPTPKATPNNAYTADSIAGVVNVITKREITGTVPTPTPTPVPSATPDAMPSPTATTSSTPEVTPVPATTEPSSDGLSMWLLAAIGAGVLAVVALGGFLLGRRRRAREDDMVEPVAAVAAGPVAPPPSPEPPSGHVTIPARRRAAEEAEPRLEISLIPKRAGTNLTSAAVDYRVIIRNTGSIAARDIRFAMYMLSASARQAQDLQMIFATNIEQPLVAPFELVPGQDVEMSGMALLAREQVNVMTIDGKPWFVPVLAMKTEYLWGENVGVPGVATAAHMIGIDRGEGAKMAPFRLDGGPHMHPEVAERKVA
ncbi:MAG: hypothetical protein J0J06_01920 [Sphingomonas sp.]|uniref:hypothetical protein n=1 Tax=Sphingomonas sp. TaxID=28214 RepID=UPI001AC9DDC7|nr:hypothetical protein [Sphingomonas sp.]MBN8814187.1 hypothetical protein [Sphingomonas sp.]